MSWTPQPEWLRQLVSVLSDAVSTDKTLRDHSNKQLDGLKQQPEILCYLVYVLVHSSTADGSEIPEQVRATAGSFLRQILMQRFSDIAQDQLSFVKEHILQALADPKAVIRAIGSNAVTTIVSSGGVSNWLEVLPQLIALADGSNGQDGQLGAMGALARICEDSSSALDSDFNGERPLNHLIPKFLELATNSPHPKIRSQAIFCLTQFVVNPSQALLANIDPFLNALFASASDPDTDIRKNVCSAFVNFLEVRPDKLFPHMEGVINYALHCIKDADETVASEGGEFILELSDSTQISEQLILPHLPKILPVILPAMVYSEGDRAVLEMMLEDDEQEDDRPEDMRPTNAKSTQHQLKTSEKSNGARNDTGNDSDDEDDSDDDLDVADWSLRKCCAAAFDVLATKLGGPVLEISLPYLKANLVAEDWSVREAAILGLGAMAQGCAELLAPHLPQLIPFLVQRLSDEQAPVRQIACWSIGRYSEWIVKASTPENQTEIFAPVLQGLLKCCIDKNKKVQEAGCSSFATFTEHAGEELIPYMDVILVHLNHCLNKYKTKNLVCLYDSISTLTDQVGVALCEQKYIELLLPPLLEKYSKLKDDDRDLCPLFECLSSVTATLGEQFAPYAPQVFERAMRVLRETLILEQNYQADRLNADEPEKDFIIVSLDLLDGLIQGLGHHASELISSSNDPPLMEMMLMCIQDEVHEVRQSTFALLGDMVISCFDQVRPYLDQVIQETMPHINCSDLEARRVCNNATWAVGEIVLQAPREDLEKYSQTLFQRLLSVLTGNTYQMVQENAAIAIGRLGKALADVVAPHLALFIDRWCDLILAVEETDEKDSAFRGMCQIVSANPSALSNEASLNKFIETIGFYSEPSPDLAVLIQKLLQGYKGYVQDWDEQVMSKQKPSVADSLRRYGV